jgi:hypothetical protein
VTVLHAVLGSIPSTTKQNKKSPENSKHDIKKEVGFQREETQWYPKNRNTD